MPSFSSLQAFFSNSSGTREDRKGKRDRLYRRRQLRAELLEQRQLLAADYNLIDTEPNGFPTFGKTAVVGTDLYFLEADPVHGVELRKLDTLTGVKTRITDINSGIGSSLEGESPLAVIGEKLFFMAYDSQYGREPRWIDTSIDQPTVHTIDACSGTRDSLIGGTWRVAVADSKLYFTGYNRSFQETLYWLDASLDEPLLNSIDTGFNSFRDLMVVDSELYFVGIQQTTAKIGVLNTAIQSPETELIDLNLGSISLNSDFKSLFRSGSKLYYTAYVSGATKLYWIDTLDQSNAIHQVTHSDTKTLTGVGSDFVIVGDLMYFSAADTDRGAELHWIDFVNAPSAAHGIDVNTGANSSWPTLGGFVTSGSKLYFSGINAEMGRELHWIDTAVDPSVVNVIDVRAGSADSSPSLFGILDDRLYFSASTGTGASYLKWINTSLTSPAVHNIDFSTDLITASGGFATQVGDRLYLLGADSTENWWLYFVENAGDDVLVNRYEFYNGGRYNNDEFAISRTARIGSKLYFVSRSDNMGFRLQWIDSNEVVPKVHDTGVHMLPNDRLSEFVVVGTKFYYLVTDYWGRSLEWIDVSQELPVRGSILVDLNPPVATDSFVMTAVGTKVYFTYKDQGGSIDFAWIDTTLEYPSINLTQYPSVLTKVNASNLTVVENRLYFIAFDPNCGAELRWIDSSANPSLVNTIDAYGGSDSSFDASALTDFKMIGERLYFVADDGVNKNQLRWISPFDTNPIATTVEVEINSSPVEVKEFCEVGDKIYAIATNVSGRNLLIWFGKDEANPEAVALEEYYLEGDKFSSLMPLGDALYLGYGSTDLWPNEYFLNSIDTKNSPSTLRQISDDQFYVQPDTPPFLVANGYLYFILADSPRGNELRRINNVSATLETFDVANGGRSGIPGSSALTVLNGNVYFSAFQDGFSHELYVVQNASSPAAIQLTNGSINENLAAGTAVGTLSTTDADTGDTFTYSLISGSGDTDNSLFIIDGDTLKTNAIFDFEQRSTYSIRVRTTDQTNRSFEKAFAINIADIDEYNVSVPLDTNAFVNRLSEVAMVGNPVGITAFASDADGSNNTITYSLADSAGGLFAIDPVTGFVTLATASLDYEAQNTYNITVQATSTDGSTATSIFTIAVTDIDEFNVTAPIDSNNSANALAENAIVGTPVGITARSTDNDGTSNTVTYSLTDSAGGVFAIDPATGVVRLALPNLNYESQTSFTITVEAKSSGGPPARSDFTVNVIDFDEFNVSPPIDTNNSANQLPEDSVPGALVGITAKATDNDGTNNTVTYSLTNSAGGRFTIDPATGVVSVRNGNFNYEALSSFTITIQATSSDGSTATSNFTIAITDVDEFDVTGPVDTNNASNSLSENSIVGTAVGVTAKSTDNDGANNSVVYSLIDSADDQFTIDPLTGVIKLATANLDYETKSSYTITVQADSADGSVATSDFTISVTDVDEFDVTTPADTNAAANTLAENATVGALAGITVNSTDSDGTNNSITYAITDSANGQFSVDPVTGVVKLALANLDFESKSSFSITVQAKSADGSTSTSIFSIIITDVDEFDVTSPADANNASNSLAENATVGTLAGITAKSTDNDGTNNTVTYSLTDSANGRFAINAATGVITLATANLNFESQTSFTITVQAKSSDGSTATSNFAINVTNIDEVPTAVADTYEVPIDRTLTTIAANSVLSNDLKADQANPGVQIVTQPTKGTVTLAVDGTFIYKPSTNAVADQDDTFTYRIVESDGSVSQPATVTIHLKAKLGSPLHNNTSPMDVSPGTQPGIISTLDMLAIFNLLNANRGRSVIPVSELNSTLFYYDVNNDYFVSTLDVLEIINHLNWVRRTGGGEFPQSNSVSNKSVPNSNLIDAALVDLTELPNRKQFKGSL